MPADKQIRDPRLRLFDDYDKCAKQNYIEDDLPVLVTQKLASLPLIGSKAVVAQTK